MSPTKATIYTLSVPVQTSEDMKDIDWIFLEDPESRPESWNTFKRNEHGHFQLQLKSELGMYKPEHLAHSPRISSTTGTLLFSFSSNCTIWI